MQSLGLSLTAVMGMMILSVQRQYAAATFLVVCILIPLQVKVVVGGLDLYMFRIALLFCFVRLIMKNEISRIKFNKIDLVMILWGLTNAMLYIWSHPASGAFANRMGFLVNTFGTYFFFRSVIRTINDIETMVISTAIIAAVIGGAMIFENVYKINLFGFIFGTPWKTIIRDGELRCIGPFTSPILAGTFGATAVSLYPIVWGDQNKRILVLFGFFGSIAAVIASHSSGPIMSFLAALFGVCLWPYRGNLKIIRRGFVLTLIALHLVMTAPVWYLMSRISGFVGGGTGWHRSELITQALNHFDEWWLNGTDYTAHWMPYALPANPKMTDITNQYLVQGVHGGLLTMLLFIAMLFHGFRKIGEALRKFSQTKEEFKAWAIGVTLFAHCVTFISVSYFDQIAVIFYMVLAFCSAIELPDRDGKKV